MNEKTRIIKINDVIESCESEVQSLKKIKNKALNADIIKTLRSMAYIKIRDIVRKGVPDEAAKKNIKKV